VDSDPGRVLTSGGASEIDLDAAATQSAHLVRTLTSAMAVLDPDDRIEDVVLTLARRVHLIRPL
jgi:hypothetical protein